MGVLYACFYCTLGAKMESALEADWDSFLFTAFFVTVVRVFTELSVNNGYAMNSKITHLEFFLDVWVYIKLSVNYGYDLNANMLMFMQPWSPAVIHLSLSKTHRLKKLDPRQQPYPQKNLLECFSRWLNQPSHAGQRSNWTFDTCSQKTQCHSCKQTIYHSTTTVPSPEIPTFDGIEDRRCI